MPLFTVCIPVYKSEKYIEYALDDLLNQTFADYECIIIDDKTPDRAMIIAEECVGGDGRFTLLYNEENKGVSATRNRGLNEAKGEYVVFLDSDDRYDVKLLERISEKIMSVKKKPEVLDVVTWEFGQIGKGEQKVKQMESWRMNELRAAEKPLEPYRPLEVADRLFQININSMCMKAFRVAHLKEQGIKFDSSIQFGEDALFSYNALLMAKSIAAVSGDAILYYYRRDQDESAMHTIDFEKQLKDQVAITQILRDFLTEKDLYTQYEESFLKWASDGVGSVVARIKAEHDKDIAMLDEQIRDIYGSQAWKMIDVIRRAKKAFVRH